MRKASINPTDMPDRDYIHATVLPQYTWGSLLAERPEIAFGILRFLAITMIVAAPIIGLAILVLGGR
jgi:hypothetical protein